MFPQNEIYNKDHYMRGIVEFGKITTVDPTNANCTVTFPDRNYQSGPLKWTHRSCLGAQHYDIPTVGDTAVVLHSGIARER
jgi:phage baseplate assembly protein gpV